MKHERRRLFIGLPLSRQLRKRLVREAAAWPETATLPTQEENLHVTLLFLGFVAEDQIPDISQSIEAAVEGVEAFELRFTAIQAVDDEESPKMAWLTGEASEKLKTLRENVEKAFDAFITEKKAYRPHVTIAKFKRAKWAALPERPVIGKEVNFVEPIDSIVLYESTVLDGKRRYEPIDTFPLG
ncbi:MAG: 2'-5' RNA ligase [Candidatus Moranbacteria bacterium RIFCSPHIGHO2_01_FULL_55_24]|nr:MAG: 2'-5' RNA ligase [Candidatus Moranbacteria bacterium RIFCSPHIGHO2_01_FULL_55_24]